jgi:hypothetical protein
MEIPTTNERMKIINEIPPIFYKLQEQFGVSWSDIIIAYAPNIYAPREISKGKEVHERIHIKRQGEIGVENWWGMYLSDPEFRLNEELISYKGEIEWIKQQDYNRNERRYLLNKIYQDLSSSMYGFIIREDEAKELLC